MASDGRRPRIRNEGAPGRRQWGRAVMVSCARCLPLGVPRRCPRRAGAGVRGAEDHGARGRSSRERLCTSFTVENNRTFHNEMFETFFTGLGHWGEAGWGSRCYLGKAERGQGAGRGFGRAGPVAVDQQKECAESSNKYRESSKRHSDETVFQFSVKTATNPCTCFPLSQPPPPSSYAFEPLCHHAEPGSLARCRRQEGARLRHRHHHKSRPFRHGVELGD